VSNSSSVLFFNGGLCVIVHVHRARECNGEVCVCVRVRVKQRDWIEYRNRGGKSSRCSRVFIALLTVRMNVRRLCASGIGYSRRPENENILKFLYSRMSFVTQAHWLVSGVYFNNMLTILIRKYFSINLYFIYIYYYLFYV
jgi:hypothetical protein